MQILPVNIEKIIEIYYIDVVNEHFVDFIDVANFNRHLSIQGFEVVTDVYENC